MQNMSFDERHDGEIRNDVKKDEFQYEPMGVTHADHAEFGELSDDELNEGVEEVEDDDKFLEGDHVFVWQGFTQRHGIILESIHGSSFTRTVSNSLLDEDDDDMRDEEQLISVVTFYERIPQRRNNSNRFSFNRRRDTMTDDLADERPIEHGKNLRLKIKQMTLKQFKGNARKVHKVRYGATRARRVLSRPGTCTCIEPDERGLIKARLQHILEYAEEFLPEFKRLSANDECAAVWCRTGRWVTLQGASMLHIISAYHGRTNMGCTDDMKQMGHTSRCLYASYHQCIPCWFCHGSCWSHISNDCHLCLTMDTWLCPCVGKFHRIPDFFSKNEFSSHNFCHVSRNLQ